MHYVERELFIIVVRVVHSKRSPFIVNLRGQHSGFAQNDDPPLSEFDRQSLRSSGGGNALFRLRKCINSRIGEKQQWRLPSPPLSDCPVKVITRETFSRSVRPRVIAESASNLFSRENKMSPKILSLLETSSV